VKIRASKTEAPKVKAFYFGDELCSSAKPGQFIMVWIPGVDEIPLSFSSTDDKLSSVTVKEVGEATRALCKMDKGDTIGVRGPFGNHFEITGKEALVVGGCDNSSLRCVFLGVFCGILTRRSHLRAAKQNLSSIKRIPRVSACADLLQLVVRSFGKEHPVYDDRPR